MGKPGVVTLKTGGPVDEKPGGGIHGVLEPGTAGVETGTPKH